MEEVKTTWDERMEDNGDQHPLAKETVLGRGGWGQGDGIDEVD